jgi:uncharacterized protein (TIGR02246 family)
MSHRSQVSTEDQWAIDRRYPLRASFLALVLACSATAPTAALAHPEDAALDAVYERLRSARAAADIAGMSSIFSPDALLVDARPGAPISGSELAARLAPQVERLRTDNVQVQTEYRIERRQVLGDIALDAGYMRQTLSRPGAEPMTRYSRFLVTLQRGPDGWRILGDASMPATEAAWTALLPAAAVRGSAG